MNEPIFSMLTGKPCSTDFYTTNLADPNCPCRCYWYAWFDGDSRQQSCPGWMFLSDDGSYDGYINYRCGGVQICDCNNPSIQDASGYTAAFLEPMFGVCNGTYGMMCGVCIDGECSNASI